MKLLIKNSFTSIENPTEAVRAQLIDLLTYTVDKDFEKNNLFFKINQLKPRRDRLKALMESSPSPNIRAEYASVNKTYFGLLDALKKVQEAEVVCWYQNDTFPTGHLNLVRDCLKSLKVSFIEEDLRIKSKPDFILNWRGAPPVPRYYQKEAVEIALKEHRGVIESCVGSGKSLMQAMLIQKLGVNSLVVVPSSALSKQLSDGFIENFGSQFVEIVNTKSVRSKKKMKPIRVITIQSLASLYKSGELQNLIYDIKAAFFDEIHHAGSDSYTQLLNSLDHVFYRFGFSGTFMRNDHKVLDLWGFLSNILYRYKASQAIADGYLTPISYTVHTLDGKKSKSYQKEYDNNYCGSPEILNRIHNIVYNAQGKQVLILVNKKDKAGKIFYEYLLRSGFKLEYISGDNSKEEINAAIDRFNNKGTQILIGSSVIGEGVDIRSTDILVMAQGGKSEIAIVQAIGRLVRLFAGKTLGQLHDFRFENTNYMTKHQDKRYEIIEKNFAPVSVNYLQ